MGYLEVLRPPEIDDELSSGDVVATEGERASLRCVARGHPTPTITWVREDAGAFMINNGIITKAGTYGGGGGGGGRKEEEEYELMLFLTIFFVVFFLFSSY